MIRNSSGVEYSNSSNFIITEARIRETAVGLFRKLKTGKKRKKRRRNKRRYREEEKKHMRK